jgi:hypothetical protein
VVRVRLVVEGGELDVAGGSVKADCLGERPVRFKSDCSGTVVSRVVLELAQKSTADAEARADSATHMRLISAGSLLWNLSGPQPMGSARSEATREGQPEAAARPSRRGC